MTWIILYFPNPTLAGPESCSADCNAFQCVCLDCLHTMSIRRDALRVAGLALQSLFGVDVGGWFQMQARAASSVANCRHDQCITTSMIMISLFRFSNVTSTSSNVADVQDPSMPGYFSTFSNLWKGKTFSPGTCRKLIGIMHSSCLINSVTAACLRWPRSCCELALLF